MDNGTIRRILEEADRLRRSVSPGRLTESLRRAFGRGFGDLWSILAEIFADTSPSNPPGRETPGTLVGLDDLRDGLELMDRAGYDVDAGVDVRSVRVPTIGGVPRIGDSRATRAIVLPTIAAPHIEDRGEWDVFSRWIETPESSNVWGYQYDTAAKILYVSYKAPGKSVSYRENQVNLCTGKTYKMGERPHIQGPVYAYGSAARPVPESVFREMQSASSKGQFVWDRLRICGSIWRHQYPYTLVSPSLAGNRLYVPRKASRNGFRVRTVPTIGFGRRPAYRSTLPPTQGRFR